MSYLKFLNLLLLLVSFFNFLIANPNSKSIRLSEDPKIIGYATIKSPNIFYPKLQSFVKAISPELNDIIAQHIETFKPILDSTTAISCVLYSNETIQQDPIFGLFITVKDSNVFNNPMIMMFPEREIVENTLIISFTVGHLAKFKELQKQYLALAPQQDFEIYVDLKNIINLNKESIIKLKPYSMDVLKQCDMLNFSFNLLDTGIEISANLLPAENSNLQKLFRQPEATVIKTMSSVGDGNWSKIFGTLNLNNCIGFIGDLFKIELQDPKSSEEIKQKFKQLESSLADLLANRTVSFYCTNNVNAMLQSKCILQTNEPIQFTNKLTSIINLIDSEEFRSVFKNTNNQNNYRYKLENDQMINDIQTYKLVSPSIDKPYEPVQMSSLFEILVGTQYLPREHYFGANKNYFYLASSIDNIKELINAAKSDSKTLNTIESLKYYKSGYSIYIDTYFDGYLKLFEYMFKIKLENYLGMNLPPFKTAIKLDGRFTIKTYIETKSINLIANKVMGK